MNLIPKVKRNTLLLLAGLVWLCAGLNILRIGLAEMVRNWQWPLPALLTASVVFTLFFRFVFYGMVNKHCCRIRAYESEKIPLYRFFDRKSYIIMACMITFGVLFRASHLLRPLCLGVFYTGLGTALAGAGAFFVIRFCRQFAALPGNC